MPKSEPVSICDSALAATVEELQRADPVHLAEDVEVAAEVHCAFHVLQLPEAVHQLRHRVRNLSQSKTAVTPGLRIFLGVRRSWIRRVSSSH